MWWDFFKLFTYTFEDDPQTKRDRRRELTGAGVTSPEAIPDIRGGGEWGGGSQGFMRLRGTTDMIDLSTVTNRQSRYKEYERLRNVPEIETCMTVLADETCLVGSTKISTPFFGAQPIRWFAENKSDERFLVYSWDFDKNDYTLAWAYNPRLVKTAQTVRIKLDDGSSFISTPDHRVLLRTGIWITTGQLKFGDELMPFYRLSADDYFNEELKTRQFPRILTFADGWKHERQFIDEWRLGATEERYQKVNQATRMLTQGLSITKTAELMGHQWKSVESWLHGEGFTLQELRVLGKRKDRRRVIGIEEWKEQEVYDLSVEGTENFCGESCIFHNCQKGEHGHVFEIKVEDESVQEELEFLFFHRKMLNTDRSIWSWAKRLFIFGDLFLEVIINPDSPKDGILKVMELPPESIYRIETTKAKLVEFQQSKEGPDYQSLTRAPVPQATEADLQQATAIRFSPQQVVHMRIGDDRKTFYPYGVSIIEPARGPAHQLRLMEDAMVVYRLTRAPERRVFYIDVGQLPPFKAEHFIHRLQDQLRKKKVAAGKSGGTGANVVEERWHAPSADEDFWLPIRPNSNTRIETLPGAQNLGEIDDALYFRTKLFTALNFPKNYMNSEDPGTTRVTLSAQDVKFARMIERLQDHVKDGLIQIAERHLELRGFPEESYDDLTFDMTPPSDWRELSRQEILTSRINNANGLKGSLLMADYDILTRWMRYNHDESLEMLARNKVQKLEELKLQIIGQNPQLLGVGSPGAEGETELGSEAGGPNPMLAPPGEQPPGGEQQPGGQPPPESPGGGMPGEAAPAQQGTGAPLPNPTPEEIKRYDLEIQSYAREIDKEEKDYSEVD